MTNQESEAAAEAAGVAVAMVAAVAGAMQHLVHRSLA